MSFTAMRTAATFLFVSVLVGCNSTLVGTWRAEPPPKDERFAIASVTFKDDNTYTGAAMEGSQSVRLAGTYDFNGFDLKLKTPGKPDRQYKATVIMGKTLEMRKDDTKVTLKKQ